MRVSASSLKTFDECNRRWAWKYIAGLEEPPGGSAAIGLDAHDRLSRWARGLPVELPAWLRVGLPLLPPPKSARDEQDFSFTIDDVEFTGRKDLEDLTRPVPWVSDHKTTSNLRYAKTAETLRNDYQAAIYAADAMARTGATHCDLQWTYFLVNGNDARPVVLRITREDVEPVLERAVATARTMQAFVDAGAQPLDLNPNPAHCDRYGGCPFRDRCNLTLYERTNPPVTPAEKIVADLRARMLNPPPPAAAAPPIPPPPAAAAPPAAAPPIPPPPAAAAPPIPPPPTPPTPPTPPAIRSEPAIRPEPALSRSEYLTFALFFEEMATFCRARSK